MKLRMTGASPDPHRGHDNTGCTECRLTTRRVAPGTELALEGTTGDDGALRLLASRAYSRPSPGREASAKRHLEEAKNAERRAMPGTPEHTAAVAERNEAQTHVDFLRSVGGMR